MNDFINLLSAGDLRSDGFANEVARIVTAQPALLPDLLEALVSPNPVVRGHAADALEKVSRSCPAEVGAFLPVIVSAARNDEVAMVRWHLAMVLGHLSIDPQFVPETMRALFGLLSDASSFVRSWAIASLCIIARHAPQHTDAILQKIVPLTSGSSKAAARRAQIALQVLSDPDLPLPKTWVKSTHSGTLG